MGGINFITGKKSYLEGAEFLWPRCKSVQGDCLNRTKFVSFKIYRNTNFVRKKRISHIPMHTYKHILESAFNPPKHRNYPIQRNRLTSRVVDLDPAGSEIICNLGFGSGNSGSRSKLSSVSN